MESEVIAVGVLAPLAEGLCEASIISVSEDASHKISIKFILTLVQFFTQFKESK